MKRLVILGAGGHGRSVVDAAFKQGKWQSICFLDDSMTESCLGSVPIVGRISEAKDMADGSEFIVAIGDNGSRRILCESLERLHVEMALVVHPSAEIGLGVNLAPGTAILAGAIINCNARVGKGCIINTGATIDHDCTIHDFVHISPGVHIGGTVQIGEETWIGIGASLINNIAVSRNCTIGAGAVVIRDILDPGIYVGVPARRIKTK